MSATMIFDLEGLGVLRVLEFDAVMQEIPIDTASVTEHVRETKSTVSDHVILNATKITLEAFVTNTPVATMSSQLGFPIAELTALPLPITLSTTIKRWVSGAQVKGGGGVLPFHVNGLARPQVPITTQPAVRADIPVVVGGISQQFPVRKDRVHEVYDTLIALMRGRITITLLSDLRTYGELVISSLTTPRVAEDSLTFTMELVEVTYADSTTVQVERKKPAEKRAEDEVVQGPQATGVDFGDEEDTGSTVARELLIGIANTVTE